jgi:hypothetical protein
VIRVGDPAMLDLTINGITARPLGHTGEAVTVHLTPHTAATFLDDRGATR